MLKSMTGYGRGETLGNGRSYLVEVRSVNNRYLDCTVRIPRIYTCAEDGITQRVKRTITRGKVDVFVTIETTTAEAVSVTLNESVAASYLRALETMSAKFGLNDAVSTELLSRFPDVFRVEKVPEDLDELTKEVHRATDLALVDFDAMRSREGQKLLDDLSGRLDTLEQYTLQVEERGPERVAEYRAKLTARIQEVLEDRQLDESRILTEAAVFADKVAVDEETVRLHSHIAQFRAMLAGGSPIGRKLDFLVQEMNRETNTIGSKANDLEMSTLVVDMKAELEKIREQIQNVE
ncbi:MAG: YicC family protein [Clostridiales bacterium]|nr:YicC family protein [Clostridiales bacterium]